MDVSSLEMRGMLLPEELEKIEEEQMKKFYESNQDSAKIVKCKCGGVMEVVPSDPDYNTKDDKGK